MIKEKSLVNKSLRGFFKIYSGIMCFKIIFFFYDLLVVWLVRVYDVMIKWSCVGVGYKK